MDGRRVAVIGHSRLGKTALWAGAPGRAVRPRRLQRLGRGRGGPRAPALRRDDGDDHEGASRTGSAPATASTPDREDALPVDQHELLALVAPRPLYVASATEDLWADPRGEFLAAKAAEPVYRLLGRAGSASTRCPFRPPRGRRRSATTCAAGAHALTAYDWEQYLDFADRHLRKVDVRPGARRLREAPEAGCREDPPRRRDRPGGRGRALPRARRARARGDGARGGGVRAAGVLRAGRSPRRSCGRGCRACGSSRSAEATSAPAWPTPSPGPSRAAPPVALVGSDAPGSRGRRRPRPSPALDAADVVLGPAEDGGYYLVALRAPRPRALLRHRVEHARACCEETRARGGRGRPGRARARAARRRSTPSTTCGGPGPAARRDPRRAG